MIRTARRSPFDLRSIVLPGTCAIVWIAASASGRYDAHLLVPPRQVLAAFANVATSRDFWAAAGSSLARLAAGWIAGSLAGVAIGIVAGRSRLTERFVAPSLNAVRQVALFAWIPLLTAWFGDGETAKVILIALAAFFPAALNTESGVRAVPVALIEIGRVFEFGSWATLRRIVLPSARPSILAGLQIALTSAWIGTIGAEYLIDEGNGLGVYLAGARMDNRLDVVLTCMVALGTIGFLLSTALRKAFRQPLALRDRVAADD